VEKIFTWLNHIPDDKTKHALGGVFLFAVGALLGVLLHSSQMGVMGGMLLALVVGFLKEEYDQHHPNHTVDVFDMLWTVGGASLGLCCYLVALLR
jgi:uncharacterized protein YfiM (DUF2279 family)